MARLRWRSDAFDPLAEFDRLREEIDQLFEPTRFPNVRGLFDRPVSPAVDLTEDADQFTVTCEVPGLKREDIEITLAQGVLTLKGDKKGTKRGPNVRVYREDTWEGRFQRTIPIPADVDADKVSADLSDGVLTVALPKREDAKPKQIAIKAQ